MSNFFRGWHRKAGCVTLVMACVSVGAWTRSISLAESVRVACFGHQLLVVSACQKFLIVEVGGSYVGIESDFHGKDREFHPHNLFGNYSPRTYFVATSLPATSAQTHFQSEDGKISPPMTMIPYWAIVIPLALLSAYLLPSKPRRASAKQDLVTA